MRNNQGYSLIELTLALVISGIVMGLAVPPIAHARHVLAVRAARSEVAALAAAARSTSILIGGAALVVDVAAGSAWIEGRTGVRVGEVHHIAARHQVQLNADRPVLNIRYDGLGIGRMSNAVLRLRSGGVTGTITVSAYGRVKQS
jgi:prepilin-type N-terminal cleavage/methylation domain-containing protein